MSRRRCFPLGLSALALLGLAARAVAGWSQPVQTQRDSNITILVNSPITQPPPEGMLPCWITINNRSGAAHTWDVRLQSANMYGSVGNRCTAQQSITVENESTVRVAAMLPMSPESISTYYRRNVVAVDGYGVAFPTTQLAAPVVTGGPKTAFIGMGETLATPLWEPLRKAFKDAAPALELSGSPVETTLLGTDWRALSGFACLWLTNAEYAALDPAQRRAIRDWIDAGGMLYLSGTRLEPALRAALGAPESGDQWPAGYGSVRLLAHDEKALTVDEAKPLIEAVHSSHRQSDAYLATDWRMARAIGVIPVNAPFLIGFICVFAVIAGPVNLFWLAGADRRHRLFWTTPVISVTASLLLILFIVVRDGFGGHGQRVMVTRLFPEQRKAVVVQEQVARTGVLTSRRFTTPEDVLLTAAKVRRFDGLSFQQEGRSYGGDWFASRSVQAHRLEAVVPSRAEVQLVNAEAVAGGAAPIVVSSIPATLRELRFADASQTLWHGSAVHTGERVTLRRESSATPLATLTGSQYLAGLQGDSRPGRNAFFAVADDAPYLGTLPSIRWERQQSIYLGPVTGVTP